MELSRFHAPATVRVSASRPADGKELTLHFVNYNREEPADKKSAGKTIRDERPIATKPFAADLLLPGTFASPANAAEARRKIIVSRVEFLTPEQEESRGVATNAGNGRGR
jgi:hypothetical protein